MPTTETAEKPKPQLVIVEQLKGILSTNTDKHLNGHEVIILQDAVRKLEASDYQIRSLTEKLEALHLAYGKALDPRITVEKHDAYSLFIAKVPGVTFSGISADLVHALLQNYDAARKDV